MKNTKIRWTDHTWNPMSGCTHVSPGCDHCYAEAIALSPRFKNAFPAGFTPTFKTHKLNDPRPWAPGRVFVNSMSDVHHPDFTDGQIDQVVDAMARWDHHDYLVLTKRPQRMADYWLRRLERTGAHRVPANIWLGTSIESDRYTWRADHLRRIPVDVRFLSCEPLISPLPSLDLAGIGWVIVGGESGNGTKDYRPMDHDWARDLRDRTRAAGAAFFFKQSSSHRTEVGIELDGERIEEFPRVHPLERVGTAVLIR